METVEILKIAQLATMLLGPLVTAFAKWAFPERLAKGAMPLLSAGTTSGAAWGLGVDPATAAVLGAASIGVRELVDRARKARDGCPVIGALLVLALVVGCAGDLPAAGFANRNQSCGSVMCNPGAAVRLYCTTDTTDPYLGPAPGGTCKECAGSTFDARRCGTTPPTTLPPVSTTTPTTRPPTTTRPVSTTVPPTPTTTLPVGRYTTDDGPPTPVRFPTGRDITLRIPHDQQCRWWLENGAYRTATQAERAAMFLHGTAVLTPLGRLYAKYHPTCAALIQNPSGEFQTDNLRLRPHYIDMLRDSEWSIEGGNGCDPYSHSEHLLEAIQRCSTATDAARVACATSPWMTPDLRDAANLRLEGGRCVVGATFAMPAFPAREDPELKHRGHLLYRIPLPPLPAACRQQARCVGALHLAGSNRKCGVAATPLPPGCSGGVQDAELALLRCAPTEKWKHALLMLFPTFVDTQQADQPAGTGWTQQDVCDLAQLEHHAWMAWDACLDLPGDRQWACLTRARVTHETMHIIAAGRHPSTQFRVGDHVRSVMDFPGLTQDAFLRLVRDDPQRGGMLWLPAGWRVRLPVETMP